MGTVRADENEMLQSGDAEVEIEDPQDDAVPLVRYEITSYGVDFDVDGLRRRLRRGEIVIPDFQRNYVWNRVQASRFIESLLLGFPVPGIFLSRDARTGKFLVIDGQQRLRSIQFFYDGAFTPKGRPFRLMGVQDPFVGATYASLSSKDKMNLDNSLIHATVVKQDAPSDDDTSMYHIFERINTEGLRLSSQEIRSALYHGGFIDHLSSLNQISSWRSIFGGVQPRQRDQELILRFLAFFFDEERYHQPMSGFLTRFVVENRNPRDDFLQECGSIFTKTMDAFADTMGKRAFRPDRALNAAVFDSMSVGLARRIVSSGRAPSPEQMNEAHSDLLEDEEYFEAVSSRTSHDLFVKTRMKKAIDRFAAL